MTIFRHAYALSGSTLVSFNPATPSVGTSIPVTGLTAGPTLVGIDAAISGGSDIPGVFYPNDETTVPTLYTLDSISDQLMIQGGPGGNPNPNGGAQTPVGPVGGGDFSTANGFDIPPGVDSGLAL